MSQLLIYGEMKKYSELNRIVEVMVGENFIIALDSNPTTGYVWDAKFDTNFIKHDKEQDRQFYSAS
jgi:predicted secreted protein